ncbi:MAG: hypothetical protein WCF82_23665 [Microcoleus sp.]
MKDQKTWLKEIVDEAENMDNNFYDSHIKDWKKRGVDLDLIRKGIFQKHQNPTDEAMNVSLKQYYETSKQELSKEYVAHYEVPIHTKLAVVLYELKEENSEKFDWFCRSFL